jgi:tetratricopeptide (TPR) repeat protein
MKSSFCLRCYGSWLLVLLCCTPVHSDDLTLSASSETDKVLISCHDLLEIANTLYQHRGEPGQAASSIYYYEKILQIQPRNTEALWRCAQSYYWIAEQVPKNNYSKRKALYTSGLDLAKRAVSLDPDSMESNFWVGVLLGNVSCLTGIWESLAAVEPIRISMEKVIALAPQEAFAYHILGSLYRLAPGWPFSCGNLDTSLCYAKQAVALRPESVLVHLGLAETLLARGEKANAKEELITALSLPGPNQFQPETINEKLAVQELLIRLDPQDQSWTNIILSTSSHSISKEEP